MWGGLDAPLLALKLEPRAISQRARRQPPGAGKIEKHSPPEPQGGSQPW